MQPTIFSVMTALAQQHGAINLAQGFPDFPVDARLGELLHEAFRQGFNQYAPMAGLPLLRQQLADYTQRRMRFTPDADSGITATPGATYGIYTALACTLKPGNEAIVLEPAYDSYIPNILACGATPVTVPLDPVTFLPDWERIAAAITPKTRAIIINTPHNPSGAVWSEGDFEQLAALLAGRADIAVVSDEVYEQLVFDGRQHHSILQHEALRQQAFAVFSFGKVLMCTGWKMAYVVAPPALTSRFRALHQYLAFSVNSPAQWALAQYLAEHPTLDMSAALQRRRDLFLHLMRDSPFTFSAPSQGSFFQLAGYDGLSNLDDHAFARELTEKHGVATIPVSAFYRDGRQQRLLRFCFAKQEETLRAAAERLAGLSR